MIGNSKYNYYGMVSKTSKQPDGFGRAVCLEYAKMIDGQFKDGKRHGYMRLISKNG